MPNPTLGPSHEKLDIQGKPSPNSKKMVSNCLKSRREGLSPLSNKYYEGYLSHSNQILGLQITGQDITQFLKNLSRRNGGKHAYFIVLRAFYNWIYSPKSGYNLAPQDNPILAVESPKVGKRILPSLTLEPLDLVIDNAECDRKKLSFLYLLIVDSGCQN